VWLLVVGWIVLHQVSFWKAPHFNTDILALLPLEKQHPVLQKAVESLHHRMSGQIFILVGAESWEDAVRCARVAAEHLEALPLARVGESADRVEQAVDFYRPWRNRFLTPEQRERLKSTTVDECVSASIRQLYQPLSGRMTTWGEDPLGLWPDWWVARLSDTPIRFREGWLWLEADGKEWVLLRYQSQQSSLGSGDGQLGDAIQRAREAVGQTHAGTTFLAAGVPLHAEVYASRAQSEMSVIGGGSLLAVLFLVWICFRSLLPIGLIALSLLVGCAAALSVTCLLFDEVHVLTLVFGASLVGVAEDYGFHYFAKRQGRPLNEKHSILRSILPGLLLALLTSVVAYLVLGVAPFPGLRQMAVFSAVGLVGAFLTVWCWFPFLDCSDLPMTRFASVFSASLARWPQWRASGYHLAFWGVVLVLTLVGLGKMRVEDSLRQLQYVSPDLAREQGQMERLLSLPSPGQFFLVSGHIPDQVLQREEALQSRLDDLVKQGVLAGASSVSEWLPSRDRQAENERMTAEWEGRVIGQVIQEIAREIGEVPPKKVFAPNYLGVEEWLASPAADSCRFQWLGESEGEWHSLTLLRGLSQQSLSTLASVADDLDGVYWVDRVSSLSELMRRYRVMSGKLLCVGYVIVWVLLLWRFGWGAWRAFLPTLLGTLLTVGILGWCGVPLQLFIVLGLLLLLGLGVDYGIFLLEHPGDGTAWLAVALSGVSTLLSFGLLALSATPALRTFGLTMFIGEVAIWVLTPYFRKKQ